MTDRNKLIFLLFSLFGMIKTAETVKCFSCSSTQSHMCGDDFNQKNFKAIECKGSCLKTRGRDSNNNLEINRVCSASNDNTCYNSVYNQIGVYMCWCNTDFCNFASKKFLNYGVLIASFLTYLIACFLPFWLVKMLMYTVSSFYLVSAIMRFKCLCKHFIKMPFLFTCILYKYSYLLTNTNIFLASITAEQ